MANANNTNQIHNYANIAVPSGGGAGLTYTTATGAGNWANGVSITPYYPKQPKVSITDSDIEIDGLSLKETMLAVKNELMIPTRINRNDKLEREFDELQAAAKHYYDLEEKFLEQKKIWETLKK